MSDDIDGISKLPVIKKTASGTTYIVTAEFSKTASENAIEKIQRILLSDSKKVS